MSAHQWFKRSDAHDDARDGGAPRRKAVKPSMQGWQRSLAQDAKNQRDSFLCLNDVMVCYDGMATMTVRTTFAFDPLTIGRIKDLADRWQVSQAEAVRRAVAVAAEQSVNAVNPVEALAAYHAQGGMVAEEANAYLAEVRENRADWRGK